MDKMRNPSPTSSNTRRRDSSTTNFKTSIESFVQGQLSAPSSPYWVNRIGGKISALESVYPLTRHLLGLDDFHSLATVYSQHTPSLHWDINQYGHEFDDFVSAQRNSPAKEKHPWDLIAWIAALEYGINRAYYADPVALSQEVQNTTSSTQGDSQAFQLNRALPTDIKETLNDTESEATAAIAQLLNALKSAHPLLDFAPALPNLLATGPIDRSLSIQRQDYRISLETSQALSEHQVAQTTTKAERVIAQGNLQ